MGLHFVNKPDHSKSFVEYLEKSISVYEYNVHGNVELGHFYKKEKKYFPNKLLFQTGYFQGNLCLR